MTIHKKRIHAIIMVLPLTGMLLFVVFYIIAAIYYPGGSWTSTTQTGFSFRNNYLCDLLDDHAINGAINSARVYARIALAFLCFSILVLWYYMPKLFTEKSKNQIVMSTTGMLSMVSTFFLASGVHDTIVRIAGVFGVIALLSSFVELYKVRHFKLLALGILSLLLLTANYYIYETGRLLDVLPLIQKITFTSFITWFMLINIAIYKRLK